MGPYRTPPPPQTLEYLVVPPQPTTLDRLRGLVLYATATMVAVAVGGALGTSAGTTPRAAVAAHPPGLPRRAMSARSDTAVCVGGYDCEIARELGVIVPRPPAEPMLGPRNVRGDD